MRRGLKVKPVDLIEELRRSRSLIQPESREAVPLRPGQVPVYGVFKKSEKSISLSLRSGH